MSFAALPRVASWRHLAAREGFEVAFFTEEDRGCRVEGTTTATEDGESWIVDYVIHLDESWSTRWARVTCRSGGATLATRIEADGDGHWLHRTGVRLQLPPRLRQARPRRRLSRYRLTCPVNE
ncbi:putative glycolipid-binding domain-containing protein [Actinosynnema sp. ALI-1.44]|uniref:putative glycolipid-binding domain-containing protein n=1 Tax=Actinosynnema sp. ALI-1.44 TaxID=1933779 RepID=UPI001EDC907E|nr:putative glycolipid-binding domain-containing protein [Actinosynnema sp. ALI-1.44]